MTSELALIASSNDALTALVQAWLVEPPRGEVDVTVGGVLSGRPPGVNDTSIQ
jgi:hypothetical protein